MKPIPVCDLHQQKALLMVKLSSIGDVVHALPFSAAVGRSFPHLKLIWAVEEANAPLLRGNPYLHRIVEVPRQLRRWPMDHAARAAMHALRQQLAELQIDVSVDLQGLTKSALVACASGARIRLGYDWLREAAPLLERRIPRQPHSIHIVDQFLDVAEALGACRTPVEFPLIGMEEDRQAAEALLKPFGLKDQPFLVVNASPGKGGNKGWPVERFTSALQQIAEAGIPIVLVGAGSDALISQEICAQLPQSADLTGKTSLLQLVEILRLCRLHLCGDTGSAHIAAAVGTRVVSLFGRSNPARLAPYGNENWVVHRRDRCTDACRRFHERAPLNAPQKCLRPPPQCMPAIDVETVVETVHRAWNSP
jgi:heptosyltransferase-1